jgi:hypothetical protein
MESPSDETLLLAVAERDMGAFRTLYERHAGWLAIRLARRCNDRDLVAGRYRNVAAHARDGVEHVEPSLEDAYLLLRGELPDSQPAEEVAS